jgi:hypothetical protein
METVQLHREIVWSFCDVPKGLQPQSMYLGGRRAAMDVATLAYAVINNLASLTL